MMARRIRCHSFSMSRGSRPISSDLRSFTAVWMILGQPEPSPMPTSPGTSVITLTNSQFRLVASALFPPEPVQEVTDGAPACMTIGTISTIRIGPVSLLRGLERWTADLLRLVANCLDEIAKARDLFQVVFLEFCRTGA